MHGEGAAAAPRPHGHACGGDCATCQTPLLPLLRVVDLLLGGRRSEARLVIADLNAKQREHLLNAAEQTAQMILLVQSSDRVRAVQRERFGT